MRLLPRLLSIAIVALTLTSHADSPSRPFLCCDYGGNTISIVTPSGQIEWQIETKRPQDCWLLPNGNILFAYLDGAQEITRDKQVVWEYKAPTDTKVECHACQPLPNGDVLIVECGTSRLIEVNRAGKIAKEIKLVTTCEKIHNQFRGARKTANGHYFVTFKGEGKVVELDPTGQVLREIPVPGDPHEVVPLPSGNLLITCGDGHKVQEIAPDSQVVWELNENDLPGNTLRLMAGCQRLPNGNTVFCNYLGHGHLGEQPQVFEVTPDKKVVWESADHAHFKDINQIQVLDVTGDVTQGQILR
ncbi:hypothetical protein SAMN02745166_03573 [Prosthecobacter debontii]|uniref:PQQ-like domain-containing protein n=1 Tax=Prosthecobacter debontii TaxID=48467 RepID=A0A1T4YKB5_9BACT|nr:PQQ-binding-like beta-propeller repeat protein [Prosthecobacter debontii]SKB02196.1 hypothetical protein SAMN02745166_03573 [Prosthecobacter debontii]